MGSAPHERILTSLVCKFISKMNHLSLTSSTNLAARITYKVLAVSGNGMRVVIAISWTSKCQIEACGYLVLGPEGQLSSDVDELDVLNDPEV